MHNDIIEICKVLDLFKSESIPVKNTQIIADRICTYEEGDSKSEYYKNNRNECIEFISKYVGGLKNGCNIKKCEECIIKKWCNTYRIKKQKE